MRCACLVVTFSSTLPLLLSSFIISDSNRFSESDRCGVSSVPLPHRPVSIPSVSHSASPLRKTSKSVLIPRTRWITDCCSQHAAIGLNLYIPVPQAPLSVCLRCLGSARRRSVLGLPGPNTSVRQYCHRVICPQYRATKLSLPDSYPFPPRSGSQSDQWRTFTCIVTTVSCDLLPSSLD